MHFLEAFHGAAQYFCHDLGMFGYIAIFVGVGMRGFEEKYIASIHAPAFHLPKRCKRPALPQLSPVALAVPEGEMAFRAAREVASNLGLKERSQRAAAVILGGVACAEASGCARLWAAVESAGTLHAVERS
jgi:hypothetical protein